MAKNELGDEGLDPSLDKDLESLESEFGLAEPPPPANAREAAGRSLKDATKGIAESIKGENPLEQAGKLAMAAIPRSLSSEAATITNAANDIKSVYKQAAREVKIAGRQTAKILDSALPDKGLLRDILTKINKKLGPEETTASGPSRSEIEANTIATALTEVFGQQNRITQANEIVKTTIEENRSKSTTDILSSIAASNDVMRKFNLEVANNYYRRSLELQYKSLFTAKEQLEVIKTGMDTFKNQLESIVNNTALPDIIKARNSELMKATLSTRLRDSVADTFYSSVNPLNTLKNNVISRITTSANNLKDGIISAGDMAQEYKDMSELSSGLGSKSYLFGRMLGDGVRNFASRRLGERLAKTERGQDAVFRVKNNISDINGFFNQSMEDVDKYGARNDTGELTLGSRFKKNLFSALSSLSSSNDINNVSFSNQSLNDVTSFDGRAHASIVKIIPGLLSKIYGEVKSIRTKSGDPESNEVYFDHKRNTFTTKEGIKQNIKQDIKNRVNRNAMYYIENIIGKLETSGNMKFAQTERNDIRTALVNFMLHNGATNPTILTSKKFLDLLPPELQDRVRVCAANALLQAKKDPTFMDSLITSLKNIKVELPSISSTLKDLHMSGLTDIAKDLGVARLTANNNYVYDPEGMRKLTVESLNSISEGDIKETLAERQERIRKEEEVAKTSRGTLNKVGSYIKGRADKYKTTVRDNLPKMRRFTLDEETTDKLRTQFFMSKEYAEGKVTTFTEYLEGLDITPPSKDFFSKYKDTKYVWNVNPNTLKDKAKEVVSKVIPIKDIEERMNIEELRERFFSSMEYQQGYVTDFNVWAKSLGYNTNELKDMVKNKLSKGYFKRFLEMSKKNRALDKKIMGTIWKNRKLPITAGMSLLSSLFGESKENPFDKDGSGERDGSWKDRLKLFGKKTKEAAVEKVAKGKKEASSVFDLLKPVIPLLIPTLGKIIGLGSKLLKTVSYIPALLGKIIPAIGSLAGKIPGVIGTAGSAIVAGGKYLAKGAGKLLKPLVMNFSKLKGILNGFKGIILKKLGPKAGGRMVALLSSKIAARAVPIAGAALVAYDVAMIAKDMQENGTSLKSAVSKQILMFDLFNNDSAPVDENGNPVKPDETLKLKEPKETTTPSTTINKNGDMSKDITNNQDKEMSFFDKVKKYVSDKRQAMANGLSTAYDYTKNKLGQGYDKVVTDSKDAFNAAKSLIGKGIGAVAAWFESGKAGPGTISSGRGDFGGVSYGTHQFSTKRVMEYLSNSKYGAEFNGLRPATEAFNAKWREIAKRDPDGFAKDQEAFITAMHFIPQKRKLQEIGIDLSGRSKALNSAVYSIGVQFGPNSNLVRNALASANLNPATATDKEIIDAIYKYKQDNNSTLFKSSSYEVQRGTLKRAVTEHAVVTKMLDSEQTIGTKESAMAKPTVPTEPVINTPVASNTGSAKQNTNPHGISTPANTGTTAPSIAVVNNKNPHGGDVKTISENLDRAKTVLATTTSNASKADPTHMKLTADTNDILNNMHTTLGESLKVQIRMATALETIASGNVMSKKLDISKDNEKETTRAATTLAPTSLPEPAVNLKRKKY